MPTTKNQNDSNIGTQGKREDAGEPTPPKAESSPVLSGIKQEENLTNKGTKGRVAGGLFLQDVSGSDSDNPDDGPLKGVDIDMPLSLTKILHRDDQEYTLLKFTDGDKENPLIGARKEKPSLPSSSVL